MKLCLLTAIVCTSAGVLPQEVRNHRGFLLKITAQSDEAVVRIDKSGNILIGGTFCSVPAAFFDPDYQVVNSITSGQCGMYGAQFSWDGRLNWIVRIHRAVGFTGSTLGGYLSSDKDGNVALAGQYYPSRIVVYDSTGYAVHTQDAWGQNGNSFLAVFDTNGRFKWITRQDGSTDNDGPLASAFDPYGNVYVVGSYLSHNLRAFSFSDQNQYRQLSTLSGYGANLFLAKYSPAGDILWLIGIDGSSWDQAISALDIDRNGNIYYGSYWDSPTINIRSVTGAVITQTRSGNIQSSMVKLGSDGAIHWVVQTRGFSSTDTAYIRSASSDHSGGLVISGFFQTSTPGSATMSFINADGSTAKTLSYPGSTFGWVARFNSDGIFMWYAMVDGSGSDDITSVKVDSSDNIIIGGTFESPVLNFYAPNNPETVLGRLNKRTVSATRNLFFAKLDLTGVLRWAGQTESLDGSTDTLTSIYTDLDNNVFVSGILKTRSGVIYNGLGIPVVNASVFTAPTAFMLKLLPNGAWAPTLPELFQTTDISSEIPTETSSRPAVRNKLAATDYTMLFIVIGACGLLALICVVIGIIYISHRKAVTTVSAAAGRTKSSDLLVPRGRDNARDLTDMTMTVTVHELSIPAFLELKWGLDFKQESMFAKGGVGKIFFCTALSPDLLNMSGRQKLVVKHFGEKMDELSEGQQAAFWQELSMMRMMRDHPNFAKVYGYSTNPVSMVMKFYEIGDMGAWVLCNRKKKIKYPYTKGSVISFFRGIVSAIGHIHKQGLVHNDIKPDNILMDLDPEKSVLIPIITDFGISKVVTAAALLVHAFTRSNLRGLSMRYAAPEVIFNFKEKVAEHNANVVMAGDVYAVALTLYCMINRREPWK